MDGSQLDELTRSRARLTSCRQAMKSATATIVQGEPCQTRDWLATLVIFYRVVFKTSPPEQAKTGSDNR